MMTSFEWFAICLPLGGLVAAGLYAYVLNKNADRLYATIPATPTGTDTKTPSRRRRRYNLNSELKVETAVKRANQAALSAEAAAAKAERATQEKRGYQIREPIAKFRTPLGSPYGFSSWKSSDRDDQITVPDGKGGLLTVEFEPAKQGDTGQISGTVAAQNVGSDYEAGPRPQ